MYWFYIQLWAHLYLFLQFYGRFWHFLLILFEIGGSTEANIPQDKIDPGRLYNNKLVIIIIITTAAYFQLDLQKALAFRLGPFLQSLELVCHFWLSEVTQVALEENSKYWKTEEENKTIKEKNILYCFRLSVLQTICMNQESTFKNISEWRGLEEA